ncbi:MAG TPA: class C beta-lactamase [Candidatus Aquilonibacter sp.]|nr:class C beta-lactamase [Candidatus Aquilonibacter sp.]
MSRTACAFASVPTATADSIRKAVDAAVSTVMAKDVIPGMAVGVTVDGRAYVFTYGVASKQSRRPVTSDTLFEIGSLSKTFTATMASWAQVRHRLSLAAPVDRYMSEFDGTAFGRVSLLSLGTHTPGGLPLQVPDQITSDAELMHWLAQWKPRYAMGTERTYSNIGIGMLGLITAKRMNESFESLAQTQLFPALHLKHTFIDVPQSERGNYAWGYTAKGEPVRMKPGVLWEEAYGVRTTASDLLAFVQENIDPAALPSSLAQAILATHIAYSTAGALTQDLIWEQYRYPVALSSLQEGNSYKTIFNPLPAHVIEPPQAPQADAWVNKTGSTRGFGAYAAFIPSKRIGIVLLANTSYPIRDRVATAYRILSALAR